MSGTTKQRAIHEIRLGKPKKNGEPNIVKPGEPFDCPNEDLEWLQAQGACADLDEKEIAKVAAKAAATTDPNAAASSTSTASTDDDDDDDQDGDDQDGDGDGDDEADAEAAEAEPQELLKEAKALKIKGIRKDLTAETLREKIAEHKAAQGGEDDDDEEDVL